MLVIFALRIYLDSTLLSFDIAKLPGVTDSRRRVGWEPASDTLPFVSSIRCSSTFCPPTLVETMKIEI
jgi:hypothetical protein